MKSYLEKTFKRLADQSNILFLPIYFGVMLIGGCADYAVTLNEQPVYQPKQLLVVSDLVDKQLSTCMQQTIADKKVTKISDLHTLICTSAGIEKLTGIDQFKALKRVSFANNNLTDLTILGKLTNLVELNIEENPKVNCDDIREIKLMIGENLKIKPPTHCL